MANTLLFSEYRLRDVVLKNRIVASPMWQYSGQRGYPTDWHLVNLGRLAAGGAGLVLQEGTTIERRGCGTRGDIGIWDDAFVPSYARIVSLIRAAGAVPGIQLMHAGRKARTRSVADGGGPLERTPEIGDWHEWEVIGPSAIPPASTYGYQVELAASVRRETGVPTSAVGLIVHAKQAERTLAEGAADLIVLARELIYNPNWPIDAAQKLNDDVGFGVMHSKSAWWLARRATNMPNLRPST